MNELRLHLSCGQTCFHFSTLAGKCDYMWSTYTCTRAAAAAAAAPTYKTHNHTDII